MQQIWPWDELVAKFLSSRLKDVCPDQLAQHQLGVLKVLFTQEMTQNQDRFLDWFYKTIDTYEAVIQAATSQIPYPGPADPYWPLTYENFLSVHFLPPIESALNLQPGDCFFQAPIRSQIGSLSFKYVKDQTLIPTSILRHSFNIAFTKEYLQQIVSMLSVSGDIPNSGFSLLLVGERGQIERLPLLQFAIPPMKGMPEYRVQAVVEEEKMVVFNSTVGYPSLEEVAAKQLDVSGSSPPVIHFKQNLENTVLSPLELEQQNLWTKADGMVTTSYDNEMVQSLKNAGRNLQQLNLEKKVDDRKTEVDQLRHLMSTSTTPCTQFYADGLLRTTKPGEAKFERQNIIAKARMCLPLKVKDIGFGMRSVIASKLDTLHSQHRDWRLVADGLGYSNDDIRAFMQAYSNATGQSSPTMLMLENCEDISCDHLIDVFADLEMNHVLEDICEFGHRRGLKLRPYGSEEVAIREREEDQPLVSTSSLHKMTANPLTSPMDWEGRWRSSSWPSSKCSEQFASQPYTTPTQRSQKLSSQAAGHLNSVQDGWPGDKQPLKYFVQVSSEERKSSQGNDRLPSAACKDEEIPLEERDATDPDIIHLYDDEARKLWMKLPGNKAEKSWKDLYGALCLKLGKISPVVERALFYILFPDSYGGFGKRKDSGVMVKMESFTRLVKWFGPLTTHKHGLIKKIEQLVKKSRGSNKMSWFAGHMTQSDAISRLDKAVDGTFLVRFSETYADAGGFALDVMANGETLSFHIEGFPSEGTLQFPHGNHEGDEFESVTEVVERLKTMPISPECPIILVQPCSNLPFSRETKGYQGKVK